MQSLQSYGYELHEITNNRSNLPQGKTYCE
jgi:hypothetical protein